MHSALILSIILLSLTGPVLAGVNIASLFSEKQISLMIAGVSLTILFVFLGYILYKKTKTDIIPDIKKYEQQFEEEYKNFVSEIDEPDKDTNYIPRDIPSQEAKW